jgi:hypothetical protein
MTKQVKQITLKSYPNGMPTSDDFETKTVEVNEDDLKDGQVLGELVIVSVDPYLRYRMKKSATAFGGTKLGDPVLSLALFKVLASKHDNFKKDDIAHGEVPWQQTFIADGNKVEKITRIDGIPLEYHLHSLGMTGVTAYYGLLDICKPQEGETVLVSTASGAVGMLVAQIAKLKGCKVYGIAGGQKKIDFVKKLGCDGVLDYKTVDNMDEAIKKLCPDGIDVYFDNVGGDILEAVMLNLNQFARISLCGSITQYNDSEEAKGPRRTFNLVTKNAKMEGFLVGRYQKQKQEGLKEIAQWIKEGKIQEKLEEHEGFEKIVPAFISLFEGANIGKVIIKV